MNSFGSDFLLPLAIAARVFEMDKFVMCSDACETGRGVVSRECHVRDIREIGNYMERWRFADPDAAGATQYVFVDNPESFLVLLLLAFAKLMSSLKSGVLPFVFSNPGKFPDDNEHS